MRQFRASEFSSKVRADNTLEENRLQKNLSLINHQIKRSVRMIEKEKVKIRNESRLHEDSNLNCETLKKTRKKNAKLQKRLDEKELRLPPLFPAKEMEERNSTRDIDYEDFCSKSDYLYSDNLIFPQIKITETAPLNHHVRRKKKCDARKTKKIKKKLDHLKLPPVENVFCTSCFHKPEGKR